jgi:hypothetical protein
MVLQTQVGCGVRWPAVTGRGGGGGRGGGRGRGQGGGGLFSGSTGIRAGENLRTLAVQVVLRLAAGHYACGLVVSSYRPRQYLPCTRQSPIPLTPTGDANPPTPCAFSLPRSSTWTC